MYHPNKERKMSVIKNKRSLSDLEFFHNAIKLRTTMTDLLLRDFGVKAKNKNAQVYPKKFKMDKEDDARNETKSWLGANEKLDAYRTCQNIRTLFRQLFGEDV